MLAKNILKMKKTSFSLFFRLKMGRKSVIRGLLFLAIAILFHAAYSVTEWRALTRNTEGLSIPLDITIQTFLGLILAMIAVLNLAGEFREIRASVELSAKSWETLANRPSFYTYNHRGKAFNPDYAGKRSLLEIPDKFLS